MTIPLAHPFTSGQDGGDLVVPLLDGGELQIITDPPRTPGELRRLAVTAQFYGGFGDGVDEAGVPLPNALAGYFGESAHLKGDRPSSSLFARQAGPGVGGLRIHTVTLLRRPDRPYANEHGRRFVECQVIRRLIDRSIAMENVVTSCEAAARKLSPTQLAFGLRLADQIADVIHQHVFDGNQNRWPFRIRNQREIAVQVVRRANRALDAWEIVGRAQAAGASLSGAHPDFVLRRDLLRREPTSGAPARVASAYHVRRRRHVWYPPHLRAADAVAGYDLAHP